MLGGCKILRPLSPQVQAEETSTHVPLSLHFYFTIIIIILIAYYHSKELLYNNTQIKSLITS
jgi:hypothetical protein